MERDGVLQGHLPIVALTAAIVPPRTAVAIRECAHIVSTVELVALAIDWGEFHVYRSESTRSSLAVPKNGAVCRAMLSRVHPLVNESLDLGRVLLSEVSEAD